MNPLPHLEAEIKSLDIAAAGEVKKKGKKGEKKEGARALQTYFRNSYRTHISLSALADRKSNIMVRLNSLLIGLLIVFFESIVSYSKAAIITGVIFLVATLISLIFAALSARPHVTRNINAETDPKDAQLQMFFFGNFIELGLEDYERVMMDVLKSPDLLYGNMIRDLYYLGLVLDKKFKLLNYSYNVFIWGLVATVVSFLITVVV